MKFKICDKVVAICDRCIHSDDFAYPPKGTVGTIVEVDDNATRLDIRVDWIGYEYAADAGEESNCTWVNSDEIELVEPEREYCNETYDEWVKRMYNEFRKNDNIKLYSYLSDGKFILIDFNAERVEFGMCNQSGGTPEDIAKTYAKFMGFEVRKPYEKLIDLKPGYTFAIGLNPCTFELIKFDEIENKPMAIIKNKVTSEYSAVSVTTAVVDVKEN